MASTARRLGGRYLPVPVKRAILGLRGPVTRLAGKGAAKATDGAGPRAAAKAPASARARPEPAPAPAPQGLLRSIERGQPLEQAVVAQVRSLLSAKLPERAESFALGLREQEQTRVLGHLAGAIVAFRRGYVELAWDEFAAVPRATWSRYAAAEYVRAGLAVAPDAALADVRELVAENPPHLGARQWYDVLGPVFGFGAHDLAREVFAIFDRHVERGSTWRDARMHRDWMRPWLAADPSSPAAPRPPDGRPVFAVMDYGHPGAKRASANIGDHVQSIASLGHLVRHRNVRLHGPDGLVDLLTELGSRTRPELRREDVDADLEVMTVHRDASMYEAVPEGTWVLGFGWFMHALFRMRHGFPLHRNLRPIFVSFHCNKRDLLTPEAVEYLKRYGPVGCRDWTTVYLLLSIGVPAFFSGCLTTTTNTLFPDLEIPPGPDAPLASVDMLPEDVPAGAITYKHSSGAVRRRSFVDNVREALRLLETYRREHRAVVTSRLHCYLPLRSMGVDVDFRPKNRSDIRFDGLIDIGDAAFDAIREGLLSKLERVFTAILTGRSDEEVYSLWRELNAADVAAAEARWREEARLPAVRADIAGQVRHAVAATVTHAGAGTGDHDDPVHCAVFLPRGAERGLPVLASSLVEHASRPVHLWVLALSGAAARPELVDRFPTLTMSWVPVRRLGSGLRTPAGTRPAEAAVARLVLADLLPDVDRLVVLPLPAVATADVAALADLDLEGHAVAAARRPGTVEVSGFGLIHGAAARLGHRTDAAASLRRLAHARHAFDFDAFTIDVLVLDLARMRRDDAAGQALALVHAFGLDDVEALHFLVGPDRASIPAEWATVPTRMPVRGDGLIHWADPVKPWQAELTPERERWRRHAAALRRPAATLPA